MSHRLWVWWEGERKVLTSGGGRFAGVDVADDHDVDMALLLTVQNLSMAIEVWSGRVDWTYPMLAVVSEFSGRSGCARV